MTPRRATRATAGLLVGLGFALTGATCLQPQAGARAGDPAGRRIANAEKLAVQNAKQIEAMNRDLRGSVAAVTAENEALREEVRRLRGQVEEGQYRLDERLSRLEGRRATPAPTVSAPTGGGAMSPAPAPGPVRSAPTAPPPLAPPTAETKTWGGADDAYSDGQNRFRAADFAGAKQSFTELLAQFPDSPNAAAGLYWLGESHFALKEYSKAIIKFDQVVKKYPKSKWAAPALLKTGYAFLALKQTADAQLFFREVLKQFPESEEARTARKELEAAK